MVSFSIPSLPEDAVEKYKLAISDHLTECAVIARDMIRGGIDNGHDIHGDEFEPIHDVTKVVREMRGRGGDKPLYDTGRLYNSITVEDATSADGEAHVNIGVEYGQYQNEGFYVGSNFTVPKKVPSESWKEHKERGGKFFLVEGKYVEPREFWGLPADFFERSEYKDAYDRLDKKVQEILGDFPVETY